MKRSTLRAGIILGMITFLFTISTNAQSSNKNQQKQKPPTFSELLKEMDKNEDGKLSKDEVNGPLKEDFSTIDTDEDGFISKKELEKAPKPKKGERK
ncbi:EF-hand domain-containing protein [Yeosuana sp.]|uniref:EF-hand domain-containing protein n=1 Tax=Yeosuana sp. TaxID=2529388 RepID=UPI004054EC4E